MKKRDGVWLRCLILIIPLILICCGCGQKNIDKNKLVIISPYSEDIRTEFTNGFKRWYRVKHDRDVTVEWLDLGGTSLDLKYVQSEFKREPAGINIDIFWSGGVESHLLLSQLGVLQPVYPSTVMNGQIPETYHGVPLYDTNHKWHAASFSSFGIISNQRVLKALGLPEPQTWEDLCAPELKGRIALADPRQSGSTHVIFEIILQAYGWKRGLQIITQIAANAKSFTGSSRRVPVDVATGKIGIGLVLDSYAYAIISSLEAYGIRFVMPEGLTNIDPDPIAMLKGAPHQKLAKDFIDFVLSEAGQKLWLLPKGSPDGPADFTIARMSVMPALYDQLENRNPIIPNPYAYEKVLRYDFQKASARWRVLNDLIGAFLIDTHAELSKAWGSLIDMRSHKSSTPTLLTIPISEVEISTLALQWTDQLVRNQTITKWHDLARGLYKQVQSP